MSAGRSLCVYFGGEEGGGELRDVFLRGRLWDVREKLGGDLQSSAAAHTKRRTLLLSLLLLLLLEDSRVLRLPTTPYLICSVGNLKGYTSPASLPLAAALHFKKAN